jgi:trans-aconitate methyltransferase
MISPVPTLHRETKGGSIMNDTKSVQVYDSQGEAYHQAFRIFLDHTDQKVNARAWLDGLLERLPSRRVFVDAGAGNGQVTSWFVDKFERTIAIEPNPSLAAELRQRCPTAAIVPDTILDAQPDSPADLVLCSHVLYYIDGRDWQPCLCRMGSWLAKDGVLVVIVQNHETDCMRMLDAFLGRRFDLAAIGAQFEQAYGHEYNVERELVPSQITAADLPTACTIAEFMLNLLPMQQPPARHAVEDYVRTKFANPAGGFRFSCHQDFLVIRRRA